MTDADTDLSATYTAWNEAKWEASKRNRADRLESWKPCARWVERGGCWTTDVAGKPLRYWPSTGTFDYAGRVYSKVVGSKRIVKVRGHEHVLRFIAECERRRSKPRPAPAWKPIPGEFA